MIRHAAPARVGILGNPSDGYGGRTLALAVPHFQAEVTLEPADGIEIVPAPYDEPRWDSLSALSVRADRYRLRHRPSALHRHDPNLPRRCRVVRTRCRQSARLSLELRDHHPTPGRPWRILGARSLHPSLPRRTPWPRNPRTRIALDCATGRDRLNSALAAGLQDRVIQCYGGLVSMDFGDLTVDSRFGVSSRNLRTGRLAGPATAVLGLPRGLSTAER